MGSPAPTLTARPERPMLAAVSAAPTVPEWSVERPVFGPGLIPETTTSGGSPKAPRRPMITMRAGAAELGVVGREQEEPGQRPLAELLDHRAFAELGLHLPVRGHGTEVNDPDVPLRGPWSLELFGGLRHTVETTGVLAAACGARTERDRRRHALVAAHPGHLHLVARLVPSHGRAEVVARRDVVVAELHDHVAALEPGGVGARAGRDVSHERPLGHRQAEALLDVAGD